MSLGVLWPQNNLKVLYHLENENDSSGNGKTLTNFDTSFVTGRYGVDMRTGGASNSLGRADACGINSQGDLTFMFWIRINTLLTLDGTTADFLYFFENLKQTIYFSYYRISSTSHRLYFFDGASASYDTRFYTERWYHIAGTVGSGYAMKLYLNGVNVASQTGMGGSASGSMLVIPSASESGFLGEVDELLIFQEVKSSQWIRKYYAWATGKI